MPHLGSHLSVAGGLVNAANEAESLGFDTVQVFTKNQRQWRISPLKEDDARDWLVALDRLGWRDRTVSHNSYLINLASPDDDLRARSIDVQREELRRCAALSIPFLVSHPGSSINGDDDAGVTRIAQAYASLLHDTREDDTVVCIENTVGSGANIGGPFEHLALIRERILDLVKGAAAKNADRRIGFCFDTCHAHAAGHDMRGRDAAAKTLAEFDRIVGLQRLRVVHLNDSATPMGSRRDRHAHIGEGTIAGPLPGPKGGKGARDYGGFEAVLNHPALADVPMILETPKVDRPDGTPWDAENLRRLRRLLDPERRTQPAAAGRR